MLKLKFTDEAWESYAFWQTQDRKTLKRINDLIQAARRDGSRKPNWRRHDLAAEWPLRLAKTARRQDAGQITLEWQQVRIQLS